MTSGEIRNKIESFLGKQMTANVGTEYEHVVGFHLRPGEMLCIVKNTGKVMWEEDLPDELAPRGNGKIYLLPPGK